MNIHRLIWLENIVWKLLKKHAVRPHEVAEAVDGRSTVRFVERGHRHGEDVYAVAGRTGAGRRLIVFLIVKGSGEAIVVSARDLTPAERKRYGKEN